MAGGVNHRPDSCKLASVYIRHRVRRS
jgi:hypothetical protein